MPLLIGPSVPLLTETVSTALLLGTESDGLLEEDQPMSFIHSFMHILWIKLMIVFMLGLLVYHDLVYSLKVLYRIKLDNEFTFLPSEIHMYPGIEIISQQRLQLQYPWSFRYMLIWTISEFICFTP